MTLLIIKYSLWEACERGFIKSIINLNMALLKHPISVLIKRHLHNKAWANAQVYGARLEFLKEFPSERAI